MHKRQHIHDFTRRWVSAVATVEMHGAEKGLWLNGVEVERKRVKVMGMEKAAPQTRDN